MIFPALAGRSACSHSRNRSLISRGRRRGMKKGAGAGGRLEDGVHLVIGEARDHRREADSDGHARRAQGLDGRDAAWRRAGPRLHRPRQTSVQGGDGDDHEHQLFPRHARQDVGIAKDERALGGDRDRMMESFEHFEHLPGDPEFLFDRLIGVGAGAHLQALGIIARLRELPFQDARGVGLGEQPGLEIEARREADVRMVRAGEAVDATVFATAVGVQGDVEPQIRAIVARQDRAHLFRCHGRANLALRGLVRSGPAVVELRPRERAIPSGVVRSRGPASAARGHLGHAGKIARNIERIQNMHSRRR